MPRACVFLAFAITLTDLQLELKTDYLFFCFPCLQLAYLSSGFMYAKACNLVLFFRADPRMGLVYLLLFVLQV